MGGIDARLPDKTAMIDFVFLGLVLFAVVYWLAALASVVLHQRRRPSTSDALPPVTMLKPLRGDDGQLYENLRSFCLQDYGSFEIVFGVRDLHDPAVSVVERLRHEFPSLELKLVADRRTIGTNLKVSNLANLVRHAKHDTLIVADSDMRVGPGYVRAVVEPLEDHRVGLVTCLYRGVASHGVPSRLGAMFINEWFLPAALVGTHVERLRHAFGATIACRRDTLGSIGGFEAVADYLADDYMLGWLVSGRGLRVVLVPYVVDNVVAERSLQRLVLHELRWARTLRTLRPVTYFCSLFTYGIPLSILWLAASSGSRPAWISIGLHVGLRTVGRLVLYRSLGQPPPWSDTWLVPIRDVVSFLVGILSFLGRTVRWNDERFRVLRDGRLERRVEIGDRPGLSGSAEVPPPASEWEESA
jgi:ceramide glucosyltransferase